ncbi:hypothetical protein CYMTET_26662 [Cymbomonas tetramitiformis]|uniref:Poly(A) RNA polymerase mitochondrial-like central palm domain-containing protein n=1 Tax=Cymbomonas tetramitiformis TaxID=36881 RepID=A0AAE0FRC6_9CHLO|nr:hypothetical protein CYMTET_26662 [Cymbomonas tetramitiformis]
MATVVADARNKKTRNRRRQAWRGNSQRQPEDGLAPGTSAEDLVEAAKDQALESSGQVLEKWRPSTSTAALEASLQTLVQVREPTQQGDKMLGDLLSRFGEMIKHFFKGVSVSPFGSFVSGLHSVDSDLDISLEVEEGSPFSYVEGGTETAEQRKARLQRRGPKNKEEFDRKEAKVQLLKKLTKILRGSRGAKEVQFIPHARVPLVKFTDVMSGISCDVCVGNDGVFKSTVLRHLSWIDPRYSQLSTLIKCWAKNSDLNDPANGTLNSFALTLLVVFHLQQVDPPILPPLRDLVCPAAAEEAEEPPQSAQEAAADEDLGLGAPDTTATVSEAPESAVAAASEACAPDGPGARAESKAERSRADACRDPSWSASRARGMQGWGKKNTSTLMQLLATFFARYAAVVDMWSQQLSLAAVPFTGEWGTGAQWEAGKYFMLVEDPFCVMENCARSVLNTQKDRVLNAFKRAHMLLEQPPAPQANGPLMRHLFGVYTSSEHGVGRELAPPPRAPQHARAVPVHPIPQHVHRPHIGQGHHPRHPHKAHASPSLPHAPQMQQSSQYLNVQPGHAAPQMVPPMVHGPPMVAPPPGFENFQFQQLHHPMHMKQPLVSTQQFARNVEMLRLAQEGQPGSGEGAVNVRPASGAAPPGLPPKALPEYVRTATNAFNVPRGKHTTSVPSDDASCGNRVTVASSSGDDSMKTPGHGIGQDMAASSNAGRRPKRIRKGGRGSGKGGSNGAEAQPTDRPIVVI